MLQRAVCLAAPKGCIRSGALQCSLTATVQRRAGDVLPSIEGTFVGRRELAGGASGGCIFRSDKAQAQDFVISLVVVEESQSCSRRKDTLLPQASLFGLSLVPTHGERTYTRFAAFLSLIEDF